ncbi:hypothetical protein LCGC14_2508760 [marine sediment metagenome]|uniref:N-acetyltransferase domain-containing protein n=1 Tax=marine sediment metagenome TaxID=412755 RepID=A0A0F9B0D9_9ZZZZ
MKVIRKQVRQVSPQIYRKLYSLNHRDEGSMRDTLRYERSDRGLIKGVVHYILNGEKLIGWSLLFFNRKTLHCHIYIRKSERCKGYGRRLFQANTKYTQRLNKTFRTFSDKSNREFFKAIKSKCL